jgi:hypothetical protein
MSDIIFKTLLLKGEAGGNIKDIKKTSTDGLVDTYTVTCTDGVTTTFKVTNGKDGDGIPSGGIAGQFLKKKSNTDYDFVWATFETITNAEIDSITGV